MYSQHSGHHMFGSHNHHAGAYGSGTTASTGAGAGAGGHHGSTDSGLAPQSSFDTVPGSHGMHASMPSSGGGGQWGQSMHYSNSGSGATAQGGYGNAYSNYYGGSTQTPNGAVSGTGSGVGGGGYSAYGGIQQPASANNASSYAAGGHNGSLSGGGSVGLGGATSGLNGSAGGAGSAHHSGSSTPTSQSAYHHQHPHSLSGSMIPSPQGYAAHHQQGGYYGGGGATGGSGASTHGNVSSNSVMSSPSYTSAPQYSTQLPLAGRHRVTTTLWEDEGTLCFQVDARGVCVARRHDNNMINGTKLLNVCGMSRGKRDGILKNEKERIVVKVGAMHLKGVWITFQRGKQLAEQNNILDVLYPLFETNIQSFLYHPDNYPRTAAVMAAAQERHAQRSRASLGTDSPSTGYTRASSTSGNSALGQANQPPPLMRSNTTPNAALGANAYGHANGHSSAPGHSPSGHMGAPSGHSSLHAPSHAMGGGSGNLIPQRPSPVDRRANVTPFGETANAFNSGAYASGNGLLKQRTYSGYRREMDDFNATENNFAASAYDDEEGRF